MTSKSKVQLNRVRGGIKEENSRIDSRIDWTGERKANENMVNFIRNLVIEACESGELDNMVFYFVTTTSFCSNSAGIYPAELALAKFSLKEGIIDDIHIRINPGELPFGSLQAALEKSQATHKFPLPPNCAGEQDYVTVLATIVEFLHPMKKLPIFFTNGNTRDDLEPILETCRTLKKIFYESHEEELLKEVKVYPMVELFFMLQKVTVLNKNKWDGTKEAQFPFIAYASTMLYCNRFKHSTRGCDFHNDVDGNIHCCLSKVRCFCYTISSWCTSAKCFELTEGKHYPHGFQYTN